MSDFAMPGMPPVDPMELERRKRLAGAPGVDVAPATRPAVGPLATPGAPIMPTDAPPLATPPPASLAAPPGRPALTAPPLVAAAAPPALAARPAAPGQLPDLPFISHPQYQHPEVNVAARKAKKRASYSTPVMGSLPPAPAPPPGADVIAGQRRAIQGMRARKVAAMGGEPAE